MNQYCHAKRLTPTNAPTKAPTPAPTTAECVVAKDSVKAAKDSVKAAEGTERLACKATDATMDAFSMPTSRAGELLVTAIVSSVVSASITVVATRAIGSHQREALREPLVAM